MLVRGLEPWVPPRRPWLLWNWNNTVSDCGVHKIMHLTVAQPTVLLKSPNSACLVTPQHTRHVFITCTQQRTQHISASIQRSLVSSKQQCKRFGVCTMLKWLLFCYLPKNVIDAVQGEGNLSQIGSLRKKWQQLEMRISGYERDTHDTHEMPRRTETIFLSGASESKVKLYHATWYVDFHPILWNRVDC